MYLLRDAKYILCDMCNVWARPEGALASRERGISSIEGGQQDIADVSDGPLA